MAYISGFIAATTTAFYEIRKCILYLSELHASHVLVTVQYGEHDKQTAGDNSLKMCNNHRLILLLQSRSTVFF